MLCAIERSNQNPKGWNMAFKTHFFYIVSSDHEKLFSQSVVVLKNVSGSTTDSKQHFQNN